MAGSEVLGTARAVNTLALQSLCATPAFFDTKAGSFDQVLHGSTTQMRVVEGLMDTAPSAG